MLQMHNEPREYRKQEITCLVKIHRLWQNCGQAHYAYLLRRNVHIAWYYLTLASTAQIFCAKISPERRNMNTLTKLISTTIAASALAFSFAASAQTTTPNAQTPLPEHSAYVRDIDGNVVRDTFGLCVHTGYWTPADATVVGCDGVLPPPPPPPPAPPVVAAPPAPPAPVAPPPPPAPTSEKVTFAADALFDFDKAVLKPEGKAKLTEMAAKLKEINLEAVVATGHTDSVGKAEYNQKLSVRRAESVKAFLVSAGVAADRVYTSGKGATQPVADNKTAAGRAKNRRVEIEVVGTRTINK
jgi:OmpA-OmpF porin, OOP family